MKPIKGCGVLNIIRSVYKKPAATDPAAGLFCHAHSRYNAAGLLSHKGHKPVLKMHVQTGKVRYWYQYTFIFVFIRTDT